jgi:ubiquinone biosynthesis protein
VRSSTRGDDEPLARVRTQVDKMVDESESVPSRAPSPRKKARSTKARAAGSAEAPPSVAPPSRAPRSAKDDAKSTPLPRASLTPPSPETRAAEKKGRVPIEVPTKKRAVKPPTGRRAQVLGAFFRFLAPFLVEEAARRLPILSRFVDEDAPENPVRLRRLLEQLGGAFIKFGQLFSMRADILPPEYCRALATLFDDVAPFPASQAREMVEAELGKPIDELFHTFDDVPLGAASFGQVHLATLKGGEDDGQLAAVKICRPGSEETIDIDGQLLLLLGYIVDAMSLLGRIKLVPVFRDFVKWTRKEINSLQEGKNADHLHELTHWNPRQRIPYIYWEKTTERVCTMELLDGISVSEILRRVEEGDLTIDDELAAMGCDRQTIARNVWQTFLLQAFVGCAFHGDPHPGNLIVLPENVIGFIDFGLLGRMNEEARREQALMLDAISRENIERLFVASLDILDAPRGLLVTDTYDEFCEGADGWLDACDNPGAPMAEKSMNRMVQACMNIARTVGLVLPTQTMLFYKGILTVDSVVLRVYPDFDYKKESKRAVRLIRMRELDRATAPGNVLDSALLSQMLLTHVPDFIAGRLQDFEQGQRLIYRKLNLVPVVLAGVFQVVSVGLFGLFFAVIAQRTGLLARLALVPGAEPVLAFLHAIGPYFAILLLLALVSSWLVRAMKARSFVKVQRDG